MNAKLYIAVAALGIAAMLPAVAFSAWDANTYFSNGQTLYVAEEFTQAAEAFEGAVAMSPRVSTYHHWLGKTYGRLAERANWLRAMTLARKTREAFERAVALDGANLEALFDLEAYYLSAPSFLGGGAEKAAEVRRQIAQLIGPQAREADSMNRANSHL